MARGRRRRDRTRRQPLHRFLLRVGLTVGAVLFVLGIVAAWRLAGVYRDLDRARVLLDRAGVLLDEGELAASTTELRTAEGLLIQANNRLFSSPELDLLRWVPIFGQNLDSVQDSLRVTLRLVDGGRELLETTVPLQDDNGSLEVPMRDGVVPIDTIGEAGAIAGAMASELPGRSEQPSPTLLLPPVRSLANRVYEEAASRREQLDSVGRALQLLDELGGASGHRRFLIAVANTAEMRGTGGMILSYGVLEAENGRFSLTAFGNIDELFLEDALNPASVPLPDDFLARWQAVEPTRLWRAVNVGADFDLAARSMEGMYFRKTGQIADGVIQIDPDGLAALMRVIGPVTVDEVGEITADDVVEVVLNRAYVDFPDRDVRQSLMGDVAEAVFTKLLSGDYDSLRTLGTELLGAAAQRHLQFHSVRRGANDQARFFGAAGALPDPAAEYLLLTVQNFSRNKLDYYVDSAVAVTGTRPGGLIGTITATITLTNDAPVGGQPVFIFGPAFEGEENGLYRGIVSLYVPAGSALLDVGGDQLAENAVLTSENGRSVVAFQVELPASTSRTITLELQLAPRFPGPYELLLVPAPRVRPTAYFVDIDADGRRVEWDGPITEATEVQ